MIILSAVGTWIVANWTTVLAWFVLAAAIDAVIEKVAEKYGYTKLVNICSIVANGIAFVIDLITNIAQVIVVKPTAKLFIKKCSVIGSAPTVAK